MQGTIASGLGKGAYFISLYSNILEQKLGFKSFHGTFNLKVAALPSFDPKKKIIITKEGYGPVDCYPVIIQKTYKGFLIRPKKTTHPENIVEIISSINLRKALNLHDGEEIECELA